MSDFVCRQVATHKMGARTLYIYRDDSRCVTQLVATNSNGYGERAGRTYYYADDPEGFAPDGPYHTEQALTDALRAQMPEQEMLFQVPSLRCVHLPPARSDDE